jgi:hypothetical protein
MPFRILIGFFDYQVQPVNSTLAGTQGRVKREILRATLYRLALEASQLLLLAQQVETVGLAGFRLVRALHQDGELAINELVPQT